MHAARPNRHGRRSILAALAAVALAAVALAAVAPRLAVADVDFARQVLPILESRCFDCHRATWVDDRGRPRRPKAGLRFDGKHWILAGGAGGPAVVAGEPDASPLYRLTTLPAGDPDVMPARGEPLTREHVLEIVAREQMAGDLAGVIAHMLAVGGVEPGQKLGQALAGARAAPRPLGYLPRRVRDDARTDGGPHREVLRGRPCRMRAAGGPVRFRHGRLGERRVRPGR